MIHAKKLKEGTIKFFKIFTILSVIFDLHLVYMYINPIVLEGKGIISLFKPTMFVCYRQTKASSTFGFS